MSNKSWSEEGLKNTDTVKPPLDLKGDSNSFCTSPVEFSFSGKLSEICWLFFFYCNIFSRFVLSDSESLHFCRNYPKLLHPQSFVYDRGGGSCVCGTELGPTQFSSLPSPVYCSVRGKAGQSCSTYIQPTGCFSIKHMKLPAHLCLFNYYSSHLPSLLFSALSTL